MSDTNHSIKKLTHSTEGLFFVAFIFAATIFQVVAVQAVDITPASILQLVNSERTKAGLEPLQENTALSRAAQAKLDHMFKNDYFSHTSPKGETPWYWMRQSGYSYQYAGENLAINYSSAEKQHKAWMKSETHRANILSNKFTETGVAVESGTLNGETATITVEMFGAPRFVQVQKTMPSSVPQESTTQIIPTVVPITTSDQQVFSETPAGAGENLESLPNLAQVEKQEQKLPFWSQPWFQMSKVEHWPADVIQKMTLVMIVLLVIAVLAPPFILIGETIRYSFGLWRGRGTLKQAS